MTKLRNMWPSCLRTRIWVLFYFTAAETLGFTSYQPAYLNTKGKAKNILHGVNFASAASGYYESTAQLYVNTITTQLVLWVLLSPYWQCSAISDTFLLDVAACNFFESAAETVQRVPAKINKINRAIKCFINYIWCYIPYQCREQWLYSELLHKSHAQQGSYSWTVLWHSDGKLF